MTNSQPYKLPRDVCFHFFFNFGMDRWQNSGKYLFVLNDAMLEFFIVLHKEVETFIGLA